MAYRVLIIDDDPELAGTTINLLNTQGYKVDSAPNGKAGIAKAGEQKPDIILLNVMTARKSEGFDAARKLNKNNNLKNIPIIVITGVRKEASLPFGFEPGDAWLPVKGILEKPVKPDVLLKSITLCLADNGKRNK